MDKDVTITENLRQFALFPAGLSWLFLNLSLT